MKQLLLVASLATSTGLLVVPASKVYAAGDFTGLLEVNPPAEPDAGRMVAIVGATLIDGRGGPPVPDATIVVQGARIVAAGPRRSTEIPPSAEVHNARGLWVLPGFIDTHFHNDEGDDATERPALILSRGVTTVRDPSLPIPDYEPIRKATRPMPRCFLTGRHFDQQPHAYPHDAITINSPDEARSAVAAHMAEGASAIKVYFRLPLDLIRVTCEVAHARGIPVTAHLELVDALDAIGAGLDGVEHVTSFGTSLATPEAAERFRTAVRAENEARRDGRYRLWAGLDLDDAARVRPVIDRMLARGIVLSATLAVFERRPSDRDAKDFHVQGFRNMLRFVGLCHRAGVPVVVGSHANVPHAEAGWAYQRELELLVECGMSPPEAIQSATSRGSRFLGCGDRLGTLEARKLADLVLVAGDPLAGVGALRQVRHVMLNGRWVGEAPRRRGP